MIDLVLGEGVRRLKGRYPGGTASKVEGGMIERGETMIGLGAVIEGIGVGVRESPARTREIRNVVGIFNFRRKRLFTR